MNLNYNSFGRGARAIPVKSRGSSGSQRTGPTVTRMSWLLTCCVAILSLFFTQVTVAQASLYTFAQSSGTYSAITGGSIVTTSTGGAPSLDSYVSSNITIPSFTFAGTAYTKMFVTGNGQLALGTSTPSSTNYTVLSSTTGGNVFLAPLSADLNQQSTGVSEIRYETVGNEFVVQWSNFRRFNLVESINFQVRMNTSTGVIKFVYDGVPPYATSTSYQPQVGIKSAIGNYSALTVGTSGSWNTPTNITTGIAGSSVATFNGSVGPTSGLTYTWTPLVMAPCATPSASPTALVFGTTTTTAIAGSFTAASPAPSKYLVVRSTSATAPTPVDGTIYTVGATTLGAGTNVRSASNATTFSDTGLTAGTQYYYYIFSYNDLCTGEPFYLGTPLSGTQNTLCATGTGLGSNTITTISANITWTGSGDYILEYGTSAFTPGTGATAGTGGIIASNNATSPYTLSGLTPSTAYQVYIRQVCPLGGYSANSSSLSFATSCGVSTIPYTVPIEAVTVPAIPICTSVQNVNADAKTWISAASSTGITGKVMQYPYSSTLAANDWFYTNSLTLTTGVIYQLKFKYKDSGYAENLKVGIGSSAINSAMTTTLFDVTTGTASAVVSKVIEFTVPSSGNYNIGFQCYSLADKFNLYIGEISVEVAPPCLVPTIAATTAVTGTTATINWTAPSTAPSNGYNYEVRTSGVAGSGSTGLSVAGTTAAGIITANISGLASTTAYSVYVQSNCGGSGTSTWTSGGSFTTTQIAATLPYIQDFSGANGFTFVNGTQANQWVNGSAVGNPGNSIYISNDAGVTNAYTVTSTSVTQVYRDVAIPSGTTQANFSFDWKAGGESTYDYLRVWLVPISYVPVAGTQITAATGRIQLGANFNQQTTWQTYTNDMLDLSSFANSTMRLVFEWRNDGSGGTQGPAAIDNISLSIPNCVVPTAIVTSAVAATTATLSWTASNSSPNNGYDIYYSTTNTAPEALTTPSVDNHSASPLNATGLTALTTYYWWVRSDCGDTSLWTSGGSFTTTQIPATLPYVQDFSGANSFAFVNGMQANQWVNGSAAGNPGNSIYISNDAGVTNAYTTGSASATQAFRDIAIPSGTTMASFSFDWLANGESCCDYLRVWLVPTSFIPTAGTQIVAGGGRIQVGGNFNVKPTWQTYSNGTLDLSAFANTTMRLVFEWRNDSSGGTQGPAAIDNISLFIPTCLQPTGLASSAVTATTATLSWTASGSSPMNGYDIYYSTTATAPNGATVPTVDNHTASPLNVMGLSSSSTYYWWVRSDCVSETSSWVSGGSFVTPCASVSTFPFVESFEGITSGIPACWGLAGTTTTSSYNFSSFATGQTGRGLRFDSYVNTSGLTGELTTPTLDLSSLTAAELKFYFKNPTGGNFQVLISTNGGTTYTSLQSSLTGQVNWLQKTYDITSYISSTVKIKFIGTSNYGSGDAYVYLDEIIVRTPPSCLDLLSVNVVAITENSATINWIPGAIAASNGYDYEVRTSGTAGAGSTGLVTSGSVDAGITSANISGLTGSTQYFVYVRGNCGSGDFGAWTTASSFYTACIAPASQPTSLAFGTISTTSIAGSFAAASPAPSKYLVVRSTSSTPPTPVNGTAYASASTALGAGTYVVQNSTSLTFTASGLTLGTQYYFYIFALNDGLCGVAYNLINPLSGSASTRCATPTALASNTITTNSASISWAGTGSFIVEYGLVGFTPGIDGTAGAGGTIATGSTSPVTLSSLLSATDYRVYVRQICDIGGYSGNSTVLSFTTQCTPEAAPTAVQTFDTFTGTAPSPTCWSEVTGALTASSTLTGTTSSWTQKTNGFANASSSNKGASINLYGTANNWIISQPIDLGPTAGTTILNFDYAVTSYNGTTAQTTLGTHTVRVVVSTDGGNTWSTANVIKTFSGAASYSNTGATEQILLNYSGVVKIGFLATTSSTTPDIDFHIDNFSVTIPCTPTTWYVDNDGDGFGNANSSVQACDAPDGYVADGSDCNDNDDLVWRTGSFYVDADGDGYTVGGLVSVCYGEETPEGYSTTSLGSDCDDNNDLVWRTGSFYVDADGDGYTAGGLVSVCYGVEVPEGYVTTTLGSDCDDANAAVNPGATEILYNGIDDNCDGMIDEGHQITTKVKDNQCGSTMANIFTVINAYANSAATAYRFKVVDVSNEATQYFVSATPSFKITDLASYGYDKAYRVSVEIQRAGIWLGYYGAECRITSPALGNLSLKECGLTRNIFSPISAHVVQGATGYKFRITNVTNPGGQYGVMEIETTVSWFHLTSLPSYEYNTTYSVQVAIKTTGAYSAYGAACDISTLPFSALNLSIKQCGVTYTSPYAAINASVIPNVSGYRFKVTNLSTSFQQEITSVQSWITLNQVTAYAPGVSYSVEVAVKTTGDFGAYGPACTINAPAVIGSNGTVVTADFKVVASPNPFSDTFALDITEGAAANAEVRVYDMIGKLLEVRSVQSADLSSQRLGSQFPSGVYNVVVTQGEAVKTLKVIKR